MKQVRQAAEAVLEQLETVVFGKRPILELVFNCLLAEGHLLLEDVPGTAKTLLAKALARTLGGGFCRLQCTPDLLPGDVTGSSVFNCSKGSFSPWKWERTPGRARRKPPERTPLWSWP